MKAKDVKPRQQVEVNIAGQWHRAIVVGRTQKSWGEAEFTIEWDGAMRVVRARELRDPLPKRGSEAWREEMNARAGVTSDIEKCDLTIQRATKEKVRIQNLLKLYPSLKKGMGLSDPCYYTEEVNQQVDSVEVFNGLDALLILPYRDTPFGRVYTNPLRINVAERVRAKQYYGPFDKVAFDIVDGKPRWKLEFEKYGIKLKDEHFDEIQKFIDDDNFIENAKED